ncbi:5-deoxy-glucuronate isomerase [Marasmitruncus massiliensis]|uniref:5-deoxy-glucuronate isomerase n=1 Tax=Marasmitruncus massiliensis TaxID=1944642 RepID=UPI000C7E0E02|nr:5-deoxy-glucuronate isomerase [Marasmitruncus massiliensis]
MSLQSEREDMFKWCVQSPEEPGFHTVVSPEISDCEVSYIYRLNLKKAQSYKLKSDKFEMFVALIAGEASVKAVDFAADMKKLDCFYITGNYEATIVAQQDSIFYIAGAVCEGIGRPFFYHFDKNIPLGDKHQIHGEGTTQREAYLILDDYVPTSRLLCGFTSGSDGGWTSWPPHEHSATLEETYCYFDMPAPHTGFQLTYLREGELDNSAVSGVRSGSMANFPRGYHPTVAAPGTKNTYFWVLTARQPEMRKYGVTNADPNYL